MSRLPADPVLDRARRAASYVRYYARKRSSALAVFILGGRVTCMRAEAARAVRLIEAGASGFVGVYTDAADHAQLVAEIVEALQVADASTSPPTARGQLP